MAKKTTKKTGKKSQNARGDKPNIFLIAVDSLLADRMSCYGFDRLTTPHIDRFAAQGVLFEKTYCAHVPTTPAYASMLTGRDCFGTQVVALRHKGGLRPQVTSLPEILRKQGYESTCIGFTGNPSSRGFDHYLDYKSGWGAWKDRPLRKAECLNDVAIPELQRLHQSGKPWMVMLRHMDPHSPYLPPEPFSSMFYHGDPCDPKKTSIKPVMAFKPFCDYFASWMPPGITDADWVTAQYDGALAYLDACIAVLFEQLHAMGAMDNTIVVLNGDHGETLYDHECWFDHHGVYDVTLHVPLIIRYPRKLPTGLRVAGYNQHKDLVPTLLELAEVKTRVPFDGRSLLPMVRGEVASHESEFYISECTWMRKHGWRTPHWKLIIALEPDFHFKPEVELYNLVEDPHEDHNLADERPDVVKLLRAKMDAFIKQREQETGLKNPMLTQGDWANAGAPFKTSQEAYDKLHIGDPGMAAKLQAKSK